MDAKTKAIRMKTAEKNAHRIQKMGGIDYK